MYLRGVSALRVRSTIVVYFFLNNEIGVGEKKDT